MHYARGKTLGGSSARNFMHYQRPTVQAHDMWASEVGDSSYTFANTLPFYQKSPQFYAGNEGNQPNASNHQTSSAFSATGGPLQVSFTNFVDAFATYARPALLALGLGPLDGFNSGKIIGSAWATWTIDHTTGTRSSSETSFLQSAVQSTPIKIYNNTLAQKILFSGKRATGVLVQPYNYTNVYGESYAISANKEVIVSAGAFQSPQLLMVSGVGPKATLKKYGIPVLKNLPGVGQNLWDQPLWGISYRVNMPTTSALLNNITKLFEAEDELKQNASGPLSEFSSGYYGWEKIPSDLRSGLSQSTQQRLTSFPADWPEMEHAPSAAYFGLDRNFQTEDPLDGTNYATMASGLMTPFSRGNVTIQSASMADPPLTNPNWLSDPADKEQAIAIFKRQRQIWDELAKLNATVGPEAFPGASVQTDEEITEYISEAVVQFYHASATCKMGQKNDSMAVIDTRARVYGTKHLRVVDASSFPFLTPGHPQSVIYMLAEKIADDIITNGAH